MYISQGSDCKIKHVNTTKIIITIKDSTAFIIKAIIAEYNRKA